MGHFPHLADLVTRINYNYFYMSDTGNLLTIPGSDPSASKMGKTFPVKTDSWGIVHTDGSAWLLTCFQGCVFYELFMNESLWLLFCITLVFWHRISYVGAMCLTLLIVDTDGYLMVHVRLMDLIVDRMYLKFYPKYNLKCLVDVEDWLQLLICIP